MKDTELLAKYGEVYVQITHMQRYLEKCLADIQKQSRVRDCFLLDDKDLELLIACLRIIKEEIEQ